ncbi:hypothetical protein C8D92_102494 [Tamilnaduibacter salinus]|uniref:Uncharacterized protein n=2 Tax=Tamilnaduibacter salinus TaxID=1484056 RepID=A0A2U1D093_9GAMM|nr:hypothetical protein C8D92_102494 [Tamilnaduibacter salinus]
MTKLEPSYYIIGTKYGRTDDMLPLMLENEVVSTGFASEFDLSDLVGMDEESLRSELEQRMPEESGDAKSTLAKFLALRPGDLVALKAHSAPSGSRPRLVIARYAVVRGQDLPSYCRIKELGHTIAVDFLAEQEHIEFPYGYGKTVHRLTDRDHIENIFEAYRTSVEAGTDTNAGELAADKPTGSIEARSRGQYIMSRTHNHLQNALRKRLEALYGSAAVEQEHNYIDLAVWLDAKTILVEVKSSPSPVTCVREALGQLLYYGYRLSCNPRQLRFVVAGPSEPASADHKYLEYIRNLTGLPIVYCTPSTYAPEE